MSTEPIIPGMLKRGAPDVGFTPAQSAPREAPSPDLSVLKLRILSADESRRARNLSRNKRLDAVCEEIGCLSLPECLDPGTATYMIMGPVWTRRCPFCTDGRGCPLLLDSAESGHLTEIVRAMDVKRVLITSAASNEEPDGGAAQFLKCIIAVREARPEINVEILTPDFRGRVDQALDILAANPPDIFNHNLETVPRLHRRARPDGDYEGSLDLLRQFAQRFPEVSTKSGLVVGLGEELNEIRTVMRDLRAHDCRVLTIRQYLASADGHLPVERHVLPEEFEGLRAYGEHIGFEQVASGSFLRSPCCSDAQPAGMMSTTQPSRMLIVGDGSKGHELVIAVDSVSHDSGFPGVRGRRLLLDNKPIVSRLYSIPC